MPHEDMQAYLAFRQDLEAPLQPANALECALYALGHAQSSGGDDQADAS